jgi:hypothetical protein
MVGIRSMVVTWTEPTDEIQGCLVGRKSKTRLCEWDDNPRIDFLGAEDVGTDTWMYYPRDMIDAQKKITSLKYIGIKATLEVPRMATYNHGDLGPIDIVAYKNAGIPYRKKKSVKPKTKRCKCK